MTVRRRTDDRRASQRWPATDLPDHPRPGDVRHSRVPDHGRMHRSPGPEAIRSQRWLARLSLVLAALAVVIIVAFARLASFGMVAVGVAGAVVTLAAAYLFLSRRGVLRWVSLAVAVLTPIAVIVVHALAGLLWIAILAAAVWLLAGVKARRALAGDRSSDWRMPEYPAQPPAAHPFL